MDKKYKVSEIFFSFQGEGLYTGYPAVFVRFFGCNLQCNFGGKTEPQNISKIEDFIVPEKGCDSGYAWQKEMECLAKQMTVDDIVAEIKRLAPDNSNDLAIVYTGGEPLLNKDAIKDIYDKLTFDDKYLVHIIETNGTISVDETFTNLRSFHFSISPKLKSVTNETNGINYLSLMSILNCVEDSDFIFKFVLDDNAASWTELDEVVNTLENLYFGNIRDYVYIMPMGATKEQQIDDTIERIVLKGIGMGYKISLRTHVYVFSNKIGS